MIDIYTELTDYGLNVTIFDPWVNSEEVSKEFMINIENDFEKIKSKYNLIILAVSHSLFLEIDINALRLNKSIVYDIKNFLPKDVSDYRL